MYKERWKNTIYSKKYGEPRNVDITTKKGFYETKNAIIIDGVRINDQFVVRYQETKIKFIKAYWENDSIGIVVKDDDDYKYNMYGCSDNYLLDQSDYHYYNDKYGRKEFYLPDIGIFYYTKSYLIEKEKEKTKNDSIKKSMIEKKKINTMNNI